MYRTFPKVINLPKKCQSTSFCKMQAKTHICISKIYPRIKNNAVIVSQIRSTQNMINKMCLFVNNLYIIFQELFSVYSLISKILYGYLQYLFVYATFLCLDVYLDSTNVYQLM